MLHALVMVNFVAYLRQMGRAVIDFALPPRCIACGDILGDPGNFCADCWTQAHFLTGPACGQCGHPLPDHHGVEHALRCGHCLADPPAFDAMRAVMAYDDISRAVVLQLKHGRHLAHARMMARLMVRLLPPPHPDMPRLLVPVPLHRWRLWRRGFNQSVLVADHLARMAGVAHQRGALRRIKATPSLGHLGRRARAKAVSGAFRATQRVTGCHIILIDDVFTTGSTAAGCARALKKAGAARVDVLCWARVCRDLSG
jgi:ComF family protein